MTASAASGGRASGAGGISGAEAVSVEEPLADVAYCYDGTVEGLLSAVFAAYANHEDPQDVIREDMLQPRLGQSVRMVETDVRLASRVQRGIVRRCGRQAFETVTHAALSDEPDAGTVVYRFVRYAMAKQTGNALADVAHPSVEPLLRLDRSVMNERHHMMQFIRFEHLENGVWFARCNPKASVVPLLMDWFSGRFNTQPFIVFDENHDLAGVYEGSSWYLVRTDDVSLPRRAGEEHLMQTAWKRFYDTVAMEARYNPELRRQFMPKRFWKNILEMHERLPADDLAPRRKADAAEQADNAEQSNDIEQTNDVEQADDAR